MSLGTHVRTQGWDRDRSPGGWGIRKPTNLMQLSVSVSPSFSYSETLLIFALLPQGLRCSCRKYTMERGAAVLCCVRLCWEGKFANFGCIGVCKAGCAGVGGG
jgi:hypothetical protein